MQSFELGSLILIFNNYAGILEIRSIVENLKYAGQKFDLNLALFLVQVQFTISS